ncbi:VOC family protein [Halobacteria archaeon AArc-curdl1]|uniref:VOC family protein n=1 Tax=Natronosalvus hydrolyticus TaxID=2979988 RepID=A0AAP2Z8F2_9EURY|nr:VOC family protein [Halobacteria archaeon AArc-curdl1]
MDETPLLPDGTRIGRIALLVEDLESMVAFYRDIVGLEITSRKGTLASLGVDGTTLLVLAADESVPVRTLKQAGLFHTAFLLPDRPALGAALERIREDWQLSGASNHYVSEALYLRDPEGNGVEMYIDTPRESWPRRDDGTVEIGTVPLDLEAIATHANGGHRVPAGTKVGHVHLEVTDLDGSRRFYGDIVGQSVQTDLPQAAFLAAGDYHHHIGLNTWNGRTQPAAKTRGLAWFEFVLPDTDSLEAVRRRLEAAGSAVTDVQSGVSVGAGEPGLPAGAVEPGATAGEDEPGFAVLDPDNIAVRFRSQE